MARKPKRRIFIDTSPPKKTVKKNARAIKGILNRRESKEHYTFRSNAAAGSGDAFFSLNSIAVGNTGQTRVGNEVISKMMNVKIHAQLDNVDPLHVGQMRFILGVNHQNNNLATSPPIANILQNVATNSQKFISQYNFDFVGKGKQYTILRDRRVFLQVNNGVTSLEINWKVPIRYKVRYEGTTGVVAEIINHDIFLYANSQNADMLWSYSNCYKFTET